MNKVGLDQLTIEITRRCNMNPVCAHCFRGLPQNLDINTSAIDNLLEQIAEIGDLMFTGGEPLLNLKGIKHTFDRIRENNIKLSYVSIVTNGLICPNEFLELMQDIDDYIKKWFPKNDNVPHVMLGISQDQYHNNDNGIKFISKCNQAFKDRKIPVIPQLGGEDPYRVGNAKNLSYLVTNTYRTPENAEAAIDYWEPYRAKPSCMSFNPQNVVNCKMPIILCPLYLSAQGKLFTGDKVLDLEYTQIDAVKSICDLTSSVDIFDAIKRYNIGRKTCRFCFKHPKHEPTLHDVGTKAFRKFLKTCVLAKDPMFGFTEEDRKQASEDLQELREIFEKQKKNGSSFYTAFLIWVEEKGYEKLPVKDFTNQYIILRNKVMATMQEIHCEVL